MRRATSKDVDRIVRLSNDGSLDGSQESVLPDKIPDEYNKAFERISKDPSNLLMVAEIGGRIVGTFHLTFLTYLNGAGKDDLQIEAFYVDRDCRGRGIGSRMMAWAIAVARERGCRRVQLTTNKKRKAAHRFYQRLGFELSHEGAKLLL
jgi:GNAT superfamily N-acetyltransferase